MLDEVLQLARQRADQAEVYEVASTSTPVIFEANRLKTLQTRESRGIALRLIKGGRLGLASTTDLEDLQSLVDNAAAVAEFGAQARFAFPSGQTYPVVPTYDEAVEQLSLQAMVELGQAMIDQVHRYNPEILCQASVSKARLEGHIANTEGGRVDHQRTVMSVSISGTLTRGTDILTIYEGAASSRRLADGQALAQKLTDKFEMARETVPIPTGDWPVVCTPKAVAGLFALPLQMALSGKMVLQGASPLGERLGQPVFDRRLSLWDDGTVPYAPASAPCDDEGVPTQRTPLVEEGVLRHFYYDLQTAGLAGRQSTGNAARSLTTLPSPAITSLILGEGEATLDEMIAEVKEGVLIDQVMGAWAGNVLSGDFSGNIHLGFRIANGRLLGRVKNCTVAGNTFQVLRDGLVALGKPAVWEEGNLKLPPLYLRSLAVSAKGEG